MLSRSHTRVSQSRSRTAIPVSDNPGNANTVRWAPYAVIATAPDAVAEQHLAAALPLVQADGGGGCRVGADGGAGGDACRVGGGEEDGDGGEEWGKHRDGSEWLLWIGVAELVVVCVGVVGDCGEEETPRPQGVRRVLRKSSPHANMPGPATTTSGSEAVNRHETGACNEGRTSAAMRQCYV